EMITGKKAFEGRSRVLLISAIASTNPPPVSSLEPGASQALDHVIQRCLAKEPPDRWQTSRDLLAELEFVAEGGLNLIATPVAASSGKRVWLQRVLLAASGLVAGAVVASAAYYWSGPLTAEELRFRVPIQLSAEATAAGGTNNVNPGANVGYQGVS